MPAAVTIAVCPNARPVGQIFAGRGRGQLAGLVLSFGSCIAGESHIEWALRIILFPVAVPQWQRELNSVFFESPEDLQIDFL